MCSLNELAGKVVDPCCDIAIQKLARHVNYVFQYKKNMKELEDEKKKLEKQIGKNEEKVEAAKTRGKIVEEDVVEWVETAKNMEREVEEFIDAKNIYESVKCLKFSCPKLISRYRMSKKSEQRIHELKGHIQAGHFKIVAHRAPPPPELQFPSSGDFVYFNSREPLLKMIKDGLVTPTVNMIGVYGTGGVGKTAVVKEVGKQIREDGTFDEIVFAVVSQDVKIHTVQERIADRLTMMNLESKTEEGRANELWNRLNNGKNNLVILDDLWQELDLKVIGIPLRDGNKGCKVILTTRDRNVLRKMKVDKYIPVIILSFDESWNLFEKKLDNTFISDELRPLAVSVCEECRGLPVAILAVGGALAGKEDIHDWNDALDQLQNSSWDNIPGIDRNMYASLRLSYDYLGKEAHLGKEAQSILLLCCLYPEDADIPINVLVFHCIARRLLGQSKNTVEKARDRTFTLVNFLKTRSLLLDGENVDFVKMHDVIRDVVLSIAKDEEQYLFKDVIDEWPYGYINDNLTAVSIRSNKLKEIPNELVCPRLHTLRIQCMDTSFQFPDNIFSSARELRILELIGIRMLKSPLSLANLTNLRTLILIDCELEDMSFLKCLKSYLEVLVIESCDIKALPLELGELSNLRVLLLNKFDTLKLIPAGVISKLTHLEELRLPDNFDFCEELSESEWKDVEISRATLSELSSLTRLTSLSVFIPDVTLIPDLHFDNLVSYRFAVGSPFDSDYGLQRKTLKLVDMTYKDKLRTLMERAQVLHLKSVEGLENVLLDRVGKGFLELEQLLVEDCHDLEYLLGNPNKSNSFSKLRAIRVFNCSFKSLFTSSCAKGLQKLEELYVDECNLLEEIIKTEVEDDQFNDMVHLNKLNILNLFRLPKLRSFSPKVKKNITAGGDLQPLFNEKVIFLALKYLFIWNLPNIIEIWDKQVLPKESFPQLATVEISECEKLVNVFPSNLWAQSLRDVNIYNCKGLKVVGSITGVEKNEASNNYFIIFPKLQDMTLFKLENLKTFWGDYTESKPQSLFDGQVKFPALSNLRLYDLPNYETLMQQQSKEEVKFPALSSLYLNHMPNIKTFMQQQSKEELQVNFPALKNMILDGRVVPVT